MEDIYTEVANLYSILLDIYQGKHHLPEYIGLIWSGYHLHMTANMW